MFENQEHHPSAQPVEKRSCRLISKRWVIAIFLALWTSWPVAAEEETIEIHEERNRIVSLVRDRGMEALPELQKALGSDQEVIRYTAVYLLADLGEPAYEILSGNLAHDDVRVRYVVVAALENLGVVDEYVGQIVLDESPMIRRRFFLDTMPRLLLVEGEPTDELIASFNAAYDEASEEVRHEIIRAVADLPLTDASTALIRRAADLEAAVVAAEGEDEEIERADETALIASQMLLELEIEKLRQLTDAGEWQAVVDKFNEVDLTTWPDTPVRGRMAPGLGFANEAAEAYYRLARAYYELGEGEAAEATLGSLLDNLDLGLGHTRERSFYRNVLNLYKDNYETNLPDNEEVRDRYVELAMDLGNRLSRRTEEATASYERVLELEGVPPEAKEAARKAIVELGSSQR